MSDPNGMRITHYKVIDSTQTKAKQMLVSGVMPPFALSADSQTNGVGRYQRKFYSPAGGLYLTVVLNQSDLPYKFVTGFVAVTLMKVIKNHCQAKPEIKWVNDIMLDGKKVAGILTEKTGSNFIIGIGINLKDLSNTPVPEDLRDKIGYLHIDVRPEQFAAQIIKKITETRLTDTEVLECYLTDCKIIGTEKNGEKIASVNLDGSLNVVDGKASRIVIY